MPFKDIDFAKLNKSMETQKDLYSKIALIDKLGPNRLLNPDKKIPTAELISGKTLQPKTDPIRQAIQEQDVLRTLAPVISEIGNLKGAIQDQTDTLVSQPQHPAISQTPQLQIQSQDGVDLYERYGLDDGDKAFFTTRKLPDLNHLASANDQKEIKRIEKELTAIAKSLGGQKGGLMRRRNPSQNDVARASEITDELNAIGRYKSVLKKIKTGSGVIQVSKYAIPKRRLKRDNILSVRYANSGKMVPAFNATRVSDSVKKVILKDQIRKHVHLTKGEKAFLDKLYLNAGQKIHPSKSTLIRGSSVFTSLEEIFERARVLFGELTAGNTSVNLRNELADLLHYLYKHKRINKTNYTNLIKLIQYSEA